MRDAAGLAVHDLGGAHHFAAERLADGLMTQAHPQDGREARELLDQLETDARFGRRLGTGRDHNALGRQALDFVERRPVISADLDFRAQLAQILDQVVGERVVVVDDQDHSGSQ